VASNNQANLGNITIQPTNAFIPASIASAVTGPFSLGTFNQDLGPNIFSSERESWRGIVGATGKFDALGSSWSWDVYAQKSINRILNEGYVTITPRFNAAIDAVLNANGAIVCRSTLTDPTNGCVPYNVFGTGVNTSAVIDYVKGTTTGRTRLTQEVFAGTLRGEPFYTWAGPVSIATGIEHRREGVSGSNDPLTTATVRPYFSGNYFASFGSYHVTEGFLEAVVPLAKDAPFAQSLDVSGAVRATDYSTSGYVTTWKLGFTYSPIEDISFRATRSRDIRAPNLAELFLAGQSQTSTFNDPFRGNATVQAQTLTRGNLDLKPEKADSLGLGVVVKPRFLPGFAASVDYFNIEIDDSISTVAGATVVAQCFAGNTALCSQITRNAAGNISQVLIVPINLARQISRGIDFEASYRRPLFGGDVSLRLLASRYLKNYADNGINAPTDNVGTNSQNITAATASGSGATSLPKWRWYASIGWDRDPVAITLIARGFSDGFYNPAYVECTSACPTSTAANMTIDNNRIAGATYFDANATVKLFGDIEAFLAVDNILNKDPVQVAPGPVFAGAPISVNPALYDTLGRTFRFGFRFRL
jgi:outer membrane receptor protein involved in Fe transport